MAPLISIQLLSIVKVFHPGFLLFPFPLFNFSHAPLFNFFPLHLHFFLSGQPPNNHSIWHNIYPSVPIPKNHHLSGHLLTHPTFLCLQIFVPNGRSTSDTLFSTVIAIRPRDYFIEHEIHCRSSESCKYTSSQQVLYRGLFYCNIRFFQYTFYGKQTKLSTTEVF